MLDDLMSSAKGYPVALMLLGIVFIGTIAIDIVLKYTRPNIGYYARNHPGRDRTFFIRNLDSVHYREPFHVIVSGLGLKYVAVHAGPWCVRAPAEIDSFTDHVQIRVVFEQVPEDASFALRAVADGGEPTLSIDPESPLQSRSFDRELVAFSGMTKIRYYATRYLAGVASLTAVFLGGLWWNGYGITAGDLLLAGVGIVISVVSFVLVVPHRGKSTVVGYLGPVDVGCYWGDRLALSASASGRMRDSLH